MTQDFYSVRDLGIIISFYPPTLSRPDIVSQSCWFNTTHARNSLLYSDSNYILRLIYNMAAIGSLVFCTDCGNLLDGSSGDEKAILICDLCGTENRGKASAIFPRDTILQRR